jgi:hypothetical protein
VGSKPTPGTITPSVGVRPVSPSLRCTRSIRVWPPRQDQSGHAQGPRISLARRLSSVRVRGAPPFPDRPTVGRPAVNRSIQVRVLVGEPACRARLVASTCRFSAGRPEFESPSRHQARTRSSTGQSSWLRTREVQSLPRRRPGFESCRVRQSNQRVGEPGRPCQPWKQEIGGSNPSTLTNLPS